MTRSGRDRAAVRVPPPLVFVLVVAAGFFLHRSLQPLPLGLPDGLRKAASAVTLLSGAGLLAWSLTLFLRSGQDPAPWKSTPEMIFKGPFRFSRNPMYLSMALLQIAAGLWYSNSWILGLLPLALFCVYRTAIRHEEAYLESKFGDSYREYKAEVRRWI